MTVFGSRWVTLDVTRLSGRALEAVLAQTQDTTVREVLEDRRAPRFTGPVLVRHDGGNVDFAYQADFPLRPGDRVVVPTGCQATVVAHGTGSWDPNEHGPLRPLLSRIVR